MQPPKWVYVGALLLSLAGASFFYGKSQYAESNVSEKQFISPTITALASETPKPFAQIAPSPTAILVKEEIYVVQRGDTLSAIARRYNTTIDAIASLNNIQNPNLIHQGQELKMPYSSAAPAAKSSYPTETPFAVDKYSERRPDSSVGEVQKMSDGSKERQVEPPHTPTAKPASAPTRMPPTATPTRNPNPLGLEFIDLPTEHDGSKSLTVKFRSNANDYRSFACNLNVLKKGTTEGAGYGTYSDYDSMSGAMSWSNIKVPGKGLYSVQVTCSEGVSYLDVWSGRNLSNIDRDIIFK